MAVSRSPPRARRSGTAPVPIRVTAVVPTLGATPLLGRCLRALRAQEGSGTLDRAAPHGPAIELEIVLVRQGRQLPPDLDEGLLSELVDRQIDLPRPAGFAAATNEGIAAATGSYVATVNDDAVVEGGWLSALVEALEAEPAAAAAQGVNVVSDEDGPGRTEGAGRRIDGYGIGWNRWLQAVQLGRGETASDPPGSPPPAAPGRRGGSSASRPPPPSSATRPCSPSPGHPAPGGAC